MYLSYVGTTQMPLFLVLVCLLFRSNLKYIELCLLEF
jgi:hypothetical protein